MVTETTKKTKRLQKQQKGFHRAQEIRIMNYAHLFEAAMLVCFGFSWPLNVIKAYKARTAKGTSLAFRRYFCKDNQQSIQLCAGCLLFESRNSDGKRIRVYQKCPTRQHEISYSN